MILKAVSADKSTVNEYGILSAHCHQDLAVMVNEQIQNGWQPWEGLYQRQQGEEIFVHQVMVKYGEIKKKSTNSKSKTIKQS